MSVVTGVTIISQCCDKHPIGGLVDNLNAWIKADKPCGPGQLVQIDEHYGGGKHPEVLVWGGGFNYLSWNEFIEYAKSLPWKEALGGMADEQRVIMIVSPDQRKAEVVYLA